MINNLTVMCLKILQSLHFQVVVELLTTEFFSWIQLWWWPLKRVPCWWEAKLPFSQTWTCFPCWWEAKLPFSQTWTCFPCWWEATLPFSQTWTCFPCWWEGKLQFDNSVRLEASFPMPNWKKGRMSQDSAMLMRNQTSMQSDLNMFPNAKLKIGRMCQMEPCWWETKLQCSQTWTCFPLPNENRQDVSNGAMVTTEY